MKKICKDNYSAVIFDLDGTIVDSMWVWQDIDKEYLTRLGIPIPTSLNKEIEGMSTTEVAEYFREKLGVKDSIEEIKSEWINLAEDYYANKIMLKPSVKDFIKKLEEMGIKIGLATSNFRKLAMLTLESHGLLGSFQAIRTSGEVGKGKPEPDVYLKVAEDLNVSADKCLVFEDTLSGVDAGLRAGMEVYSVYDKESEDNKGLLLEKTLGMVYDYNEIIESKM